MIVYEVVNGDNNASKIRCPLHKIYVPTGLGSTKPDKDTGNKYGYHKLRGRTVKSLRYKSQSWYTSYLPLDRRGIRQKNCFDLTILQKSAIIRYSNSPLVGWVKLNI